MHYTSIVVFQFRLIVFSEWPYYNNSHITHMSKTKIKNTNKAFNMTHVIQ